VYRQHYTDIEGVSSDAQLVGWIIVAQYDVESGGPEPLTLEQRAARLRELEEWGVDLSLIRTALARTPTERILMMEDRLAFIEEMQRAWQSQYGRRSVTGTATEGS
jgi:hypothetical protein